jgi:hypothetical protein
MLNDHAKRGSGVAAAILLALILAGCGGGSQDPGAAKNSKAASKLAPVLDKCQDTISEAVGGLKGGEVHTTGEFISLSDGSLLIETPSPQGDRMSLIALIAAECVLSETNAPGSVRQAIESTTGMDGRQSETYGDYKVSWSYSGADPAHFEAAFDETSGN